MSPLRYALALMVMITIVSFFSYVIEDISPQYLMLFEVSISLLGITFISTYLIDVLFRVNELQKNQLKIKDTVEEKAIIEPVIEKMRPLHNFIREIGEVIIDDQVKSINITNNGFSITGKDWAMRANRVFWTDLKPIAAEEKRKGRLLVCYVLHSSDPRLWLEAASLESMKQQQDLIQAGAKIERIILGQEPVNEITSAVASIDWQDEAEFLRRAIKPHQFLDRNPSRADYANAIILMIMHNIDVYYNGYYNGNRDIQEDFASVDLEGTELVMKWSYTHGLGRVQDCVFERSTGEYKSNWDRLRIHATPMNGIASGRKS